MANETYGIEFFLRRSLSWSRNSPLIWNRKVHYCIYTRLPLHPILRHMNPVHNRKPFVRSTATLYSAIGRSLPSTNFPSRFAGEISAKILYFTLTMHSICLTYLIFDSTTLTTKLPLLQQQFSVATVNSEGAWGRGCPRLLKEFKAPRALWFSAIWDVKALHD